MKLFLAILAWLVMGAVLSAGLLMAVHGSPWLLLIGIIGFVVAIAKIACLAH